MTKPAVLNGTPVPQGSLNRSRSGHTYHRNSRTLKAWRLNIANAYMEANPHAVLLDQAVSVSILFRIDPPKRLVRLLPWVKPDIDKLTRAVLDALTGAAYKDDGQVTALHVMKRYATAEHPAGVWVQVSEDHGADVIGWSVPSQREAAA